MTNVNEYNVETGEYMLRPFTSNEIKQNQIDSSIGSGYIEVPNSLTKEEMDQQIINQIISLGYTEEQARTIAGI